MLILLGDTMARITVKGFMTCIVCTGIFHLIVFRRTYLDSYTKYSLRENMISEIGQFEDGNSLPKDMDARIEICQSRKELNLYKVSEVHCAAILDNNEEEIRKARTVIPTHSISDLLLEEQTANCSLMRQLYPSCAYSTEEMQYPIAYSILCHTDAVQVERLLRILYQPQNVYCIHPDKKASPTFHKILQNVAACFPNVFIASKLEDVVYASYFRLKAEINCMLDLLNRPEKLRYMIGIT